MKNDLKTDFFKTTTPLIEITINPEFKAKVANLLNRLKEQLYKLKVAQQEVNTTSTPAIGFLKKTNNTLVTKISTKEENPTITIALKKVKNFDFKNF